MAERGLSRSISRHRSFELSSSSLANFYYQNEVSFLGFSFVGNLFLRL